MIDPLDSNLNPWITADILDRIDADPGWQRLEVAERHGKAWIRDESLLQ